MNFFKRLKLFLAMIVVGIGCFGLVVYENNAIATVGANSASLVASTYTVGSEYSGLISQQYVNAGETVAAGQKLFELKSDTLTTDLTSEKVAAQRLTNPLSNDGGIILKAQNAGVVTEISHLKGSFVGAGDSIATISSTANVKVRSNFEFSGQQYAKVSPNTPMIVTLGGKNITARISGITQQSTNGHTITTIIASLPDITNDQTIYSTGTPAKAKLVLDSNPLYNRIKDIAATNIVEKL